MKALRLICTAALAALALPTMAQQSPASGDRATARPQAGAIAAAKIQARVEAIDKAARTVTLKGPMGRVLTLGVGPEHWRVLALCHERRNAAQYEGVFEVDEKLMAELVRATDAVRAALEALPPLK